MEVVRGDERGTGEIVVLGVDDYPMPEAIRPAPGEVRLQADGPDRWLAVGARPSDWAAFGAAAVRSVPPGTVVFRTVPAADELGEFIRGWRLGGYRYGGPTDRRVLMIPPEAPDITAVMQQTDAVIEARELVNTPSNIKNPEWMVRHARAVAGRVGAQIEVLGQRRLQEEGFGGVLAVGAGSTTRPRVVVIRRPGDGPRVALVGKGVTFDSGGLSLKPREAMMLMKSDMAGAAAVLTALTVAPPHVDLTVLIGLAENALGEASYRPGDVITHVDGRTTEVRNTDAEGRLILADLLAHARREYAPDVMVDVATLTGAATMALSREMAALFTPDPGLEKALVDAGGSSGDRVWAMPLVESYRSALRSEIADQCHIPVKEGVGAGAITAALFLQPFAGEGAWAHLDIAGPARSTTGSGLRTVGGTGFGVALLGRWLADGARF